MKSVSRDRAPVTAIEEGINCCRLESSFKKKNAQRTGSSRPDALERWTATGQKPTFDHLPESGHLFLAPEPKNYPQVSGILELLY